MAFTKAEENTYHRKIQSLTRDIETFKPPTGVSRDEWSMIDNRLMDLEASVPSDVASTSQQITGDTNLSTTLSGFQL